MQLNFKSVTFALALLICGFGLSHLLSSSTTKEKEDVSHQERFNQNYNIYSLNLPEQLEFAGETVPTQLVDVKEKLDRELLVNTYWQSNTLLYIKRSKKWFPTIEPILEKNGIPNDFKYLALIESGLTQIISPAGAVGFWQIMEGTGRELGLEINSQVDERYHIEKATEAACRYLLKAKEKYGSWTLAAASYNMGMHGLDKQLERQKVNNYYDLLLNEETARYLYRILAAKTILSSPQSFGFNYRQKDLWYQVACDEIEIDSSVDNWADFAADQGINYKVLKYLNPWLRTSYLRNNSSKTYLVKVPTDEAKKQLMQ